MIGKKLFQNNPFANELKLFLDRNEITVNEIATKLNLTKSVIYQYLSGNVKPSYEVLETLHNMGLPLEKVFGRESEAFKEKDVRPQPVQNDYDIEKLDILERIKIKNITVNLEEVRRLLQYAEDRNELPLFISALKTAASPNVPFLQKNAYSKYFNDLLIVANCKIKAQSEGGRKGKRGPAVKI